MAKKRLLTAGAAAIALASVVGVGFSAWTFSNQSRVDLNSNVFITHANTFGSFGTAKAVTGTSEATTACVKLDQPDAANSDTGISLVSSAQETAAAVNKITATWTVSYASYKDTLKTSSSDINTLSDSNIEYSVIVYIHKNTLGKYVKVGGSYKDYSVNPEAFRPVAGDHNHRTDYNAYKLTLTAATSAVADSSSGVQVTIPASETSQVTAAFTLDAQSIPFVWQTEDATKGLKGAPDTFDEYKDMVKDLGCTGVTNASDVVGGTAYQTDIATPLVIIEFCVYNTGVTLSV